MIADTSDDLMWSLFDDLMSSVLPWTSPRSISDALRSDVMRPLSGA